ncbi:hypothetical protein [Caenimonas sp. SL110]|uniref:hypothetical protein n=1 Tax=Caenimonas sp. SL110 TaxID=1450524 RepID=UPI000653EFF0|nr:hypothetical protein [Caenimonas sp. SL110]
MDSLTSWARKTTTTFAELRMSVMPRSEVDEPGEGLAYQLRHWPDLSGARTADMLRALSVMSHRPVNRRWILASTRLTAVEVDNLIARLIAQDAVTVIDTGRYAGLGAG